MSALIFLHNFFMRCSRTLQFIQIERHGKQSMYFYISDISCRDECTSGKSNAIEELMGTENVLHII